MREIKFRVFQPATKTMHYSDHNDIMRCGDGWEWSMCVVSFEEQDNDSA